MPTNRGKSKGFSNSKGKGKSKAKADYMKQKWYGSVYLILIHKNYILAKFKHAL